MARVVILSGAGLSAQSGISTFRDNNGLWENYDISVVCDASSMINNKKITLDFYDKRREDIKNKVPNYAHEVLVKLKREFSSDIALITQNVDDLFEKAGLKEDELIHLHGFLPEVRCQNKKCEEIYNISYKKINTMNEGYCKKCNTQLRPNIIFFGESAPKYENLHYELNDCEFIVIIGTSGNVIDVNYMANNIKYSILNNLEQSDAIEDSLFSKVIYDKVSDVIDEIYNDVKEFLNASK